ncbi:hypothetical protein GCM10009730_51310 [Streptomyces albidochromogenes]
MSSSAACATELTTAEWIRSVLTCTGSLTLVTDGHRSDLAGLYTVDGKGRLTLRLPAGSPLLPQATCASDDTPAPLLEFTDIAPTAVRDRVRARVYLSGRLIPSDPEGAAGRSHHLGLTRATLETASAIAAVRLDELALAAAEPLTVQESALLTHSTNAHRNVLARLSRLARRSSPRNRWQPLCTPHQDRTHTAALLQYDDRTVPLHRGMMKGGRHWVALT